MSVLLWVIGRDCCSCRPVMVGLQKPPLDFSGGPATIALVVLRTDELLPYRQVGISY